MGNKFYVLTNSYHYYAGELKDNKLRYTNDYYRAFRFKSKRAAMAVVKNTPTLKNFRPVMIEIKKTSDC